MLHLDLDENHEGSCASATGSLVDESFCPSGQLQGASVSSFDYGSCLESEDCSVVREYSRHSGDAKSRDLKRALAKALLMTGPIAVVLLAAQKHF